MTQRISVQCSDSPTTPPRLIGVGRDDSLWLSDHNADAIQEVIDKADLWDAYQAQIADLPDGVSLGHDGRMFAVGGQVPKELEFRCTNIDREWRTWAERPPTTPVLYEVRPPQKPATERVPWQRSIGRTLPVGKKIIGADETTTCPRIKFGTPQNATYSLVSDGMVEVLTEAES